MAGDSEVYQHEALADDERRYLRRQKPVEVRRRKFSRRGWPAVRRWMTIGVVASGTVAAAWFSTQFFLSSPKVKLAAYDQIEIIGNHYVSSSTVAERFASDLGQSVLRVPLEARRQSLEAIPWVAQVSVQRALPNHIRIEIAERVPVAFLRTTAGLALVDAQGVILERPLEAEFHFPVISGLSEAMPLADREKRMAMFQSFLRDADLARAGASDGVSEVDLADAVDLRATLTGLPGFDSEAPLVVRFGDQDFVNKYRLLVENADQWRQRTGRIESIDLRFARQVVVNPEQETASTRP